MYKSKIEIAKELINEIISLIKIDIVVMDGFYAFSELMQWMISYGIKFEMRFHANRKIIPKDVEKPIKIKDYFESINNKKIQYRTIEEIWREMKLYFTAVKRTNKKGILNVVYQVSNYKKPPRDHAKIYSFRWNIEKFFRISK